MEVEADLAPPAGALPPSVETLLQSAGPFDEELAECTGGKTAEFLAAEQTRLAANEACHAQLGQISENLGKKKYHQAFVATEAYLTDNRFASEWDCQAPEAKMTFMAVVMKPIMMKLNATRLLTLLRQIVDRCHGLRAMKFLSLWLPVLKESKCSILMYKSVLGLQLLELGKSAECEELLFEVVEKEIENAYGLPSAVEAEFHRSAAAFYWTKLDYDAYYKHGMFYLEGRDPDRAEASDDITLAKRLCRSVLLSEKIYSFTELLQNPILSSISPGGSSYPSQSLLRDLLVMCNSGDLPMFESFLSNRQAQIEAEGLTPSLPLLHSKITIFALLEMAFLKPQKERVLSFEEIVHACKVKFDEVERLVMRVMAHGLMKGAIDGVNLTVTFSNLQPRLLDDEKIRPLSDQFASWSTQISSVVASMERLFPNVQSLSLPSVPSSTTQ